MGQVGANELKNGMKVLVDSGPQTVVSVELVKPGKGQAFTRTRLKHLMTGRVVERTFKSNEKLELADVLETKMRMLYSEQDGVVFMDDNTFEQVTVPFDVLGTNKVYIMEELLYDLVFYQGSVIDVIPPNFLSMKIAETEPGARGDTSSGRVLKPAITETGAKVQVPIFIDEGETVKIDTRTGEYVSRV